MLLDFFCLDDEELDDGVEADKAAVASGSIARLERDEG